MELDECSWIQHIAMSKWQEMLSYPQYIIHRLFSFVFLHIKKVESLDHTTTELGGRFKAHSTDSAIKPSFLLFSYCCGNKCVLSAK